MSRLLSRGDLVQVLEGVFKGQVGSVEGLCSCPRLIVTAFYTGDLTYRVSIGAGMCFRRDHLRKLDGDEDPNRVVEWDQVPGGKPKVEEAA